MMGVGLIALLLPGAMAEGVDPKIERLERLERALQIEDCNYAVEELEHLNVSYSAMALRYALLAEGYLCIGKPDKSKLAVQEFARLGGEANQLSMRVQEFCALQECTLTPVLVRPVEQESTAAVDVVSSSEDVEEVRIKPLSSESIAEASSVTQPPQDPIAVELEKVKEIAEVEEARIEPATSTVTVPDGATLFSVSEINAMVVDGQCAEAASAGATLVAVEPENALAHMAFGDALACFPEGSGDIFAAFDAWMLAKSLAKTQQMDWQPMKERIGWALARSGIVKIIPDFENGYTDWPEGFSVELESATPVNLEPRTDHMLGGIYLTNLPEGEAALRITPGGARLDIVQNVIIKAGELLKISVPIGAETHVGLPSILAPEGYAVTFENVDGTTIAYNLKEGLLLPKGIYTVTAEYGGQQYEFQSDLTAFTGATPTEGVVQDSFRDQLPWVYQVRNPKGMLLSEGLVYPDQDAQEVTVQFEKGYLSDSEDPTQGEAVQLVASGSIAKLNQSLFNEVVIDPGLHPFYRTLEQWLDAEQDLTDTYGSTQWLTGTMLTAGAWTGVSLALANGDREDQGFWESQAVAGALLTVPMVAIWMNEKLRVEPSRNRVGEDLYSMLWAMDGTPVPFDDLIPIPESFQDGLIEDSQVEEPQVEEGTEVVEDEEVDVEEVEQGEEVKETEEAEQPDDINQ